MLNRRWFVISLFAPLAAGGCATWKTIESDNPLDAVNGEASLDHPHRLTIDFEFVPIDAVRFDDEAATALWNRIDETVIDVPTRRRYLDNGLRVGVLDRDDDFFDNLRSLAKSPNIVDSFLAKASVGGNVGRSKRRVPMRTGRRHELPLHQPAPGVEVAMLVDDEQIIARSLDNAQHVLAVTPLADEVAAARVRLRMEPEIQYGSNRPKFTRGESAFRIDTRRDAWRLDALSLELTVAEHQTIVLAADYPTRGIAESMLAGTDAAGNLERSVLLIRVVNVPTAVERL